ncbi:hypothetical protein N7517_005537 [Penicillium concentricum]|uniref:C2H2-type domain-containing protein n=1 Tax=Penicillium concentricum TaxID=293559 RepID=A0A9W9S7K4_9EURO|nr:uncharacterized protein N7517_005537 [Penicillium concentricum]KAJ5373531.1 hypothetical protein N7517_005537 [Penicillium concentricum]
MANTYTSLFERSLEAFKKDLNKKERDNFKISTLEDLEQCLTQLQVKHRSQRRVQNLNRLKPFLEALNQFGKVVEVFCNSSEIVPFIWGPVKFLLLIADSFESALSELLDTYEYIGENLPLLLQYQELFRTNPHMIKVLSLMYEDILKFHRLAIQYFQQRLWKQLWHATWKTQKSRFSNIISGMARHRALIESQAGLSQIEDFQESRRVMDGRHNVEVQDEASRRSRTVFNWLKAPDVDGNQYNLTQTRAGHPGTGRWLLENQAFKDWFDPNYPKIPPLLWLNGIPGAGKTVLASLAIEETRKLTPKPTVLFFYCKHGDPERNNFLALARSLLAQILEQDQNLLLYFYQQCCNSKDAVLTSPEKVTTLLTFALKNCKSAYIIIDGLDECERDQRKDIAQWFRTLVETLPIAEPWRLRCLFTSQNDSLSRKDFDEIASLTIRTDDIKNDLQGFCRREADQLRASLYISEDMADSIAARVAQQAGGMFLLAKLIWLNLSAQTTIVGLEQELDPNIFPTEVNDAQGFLVKDPRDICGSFVEVRDDGSVELIHLTARLFLVDQGLVDPLRGDIRMAARCVNYLNFPLFVNAPLEHNIRRGDYGFMEYSVIHWVRHLEGAIAEANRRIERTKAEATRPRQSTPEEPNGPNNFIALREEDYYAIMAPLTESLGVFIDLHWSPPKKYLEVSTRNKKRLQVFQDVGFYARLEQIVVSTKKQLHSFGPLKQEELALNLFSIVGDVRKIIERIVSTDPSSEKEMVQKYGDHLFRCPRFSCQFFSSGFPSSVEREKHTSRHTRAWRCSDEKCTGFSFGFISEVSLKRHMKDSHPGVLQSQDFPSDRDIELSLRLRTPQIHATTQRAPEVRSAQAVPATPDVPAHTQEPPSSDSEPEVRPMKRPKTQEKQDFKCPHCAKDFKRLFNLKSHLLTHTADRPFSCDVCYKRFSRKSDCIRHAKTHSGEKVWVCEGCLVPFARADMLNNHHRAPIGQACLTKIQSQSQDHLL